jgi:maltooligosyltrehalose trehalohydrolase
LGAGSRYAFALPNGVVVPDPASRFQPDYIDGESEVVDASQFVWQQSFQGRPWHEAVIYELHIGSFTTEGTWAAAATKLRHLVELGVTVVQIMPVAEFFAISTGAMTARSGLPLQRATASPMTSVGSSTRRIGTA